MLTKIIFKFGLVEMQFPLFYWTNFLTVFNQFHKSGSGERTKLNVIENGDTEAVMMYCGIHAIGPLKLV